MGRQPADEGEALAARQLQQLRQQLEDELATRRNHLRLCWIRAYRRLLSLQLITPAQFDAILQLLDRIEELGPDDVVKQLQQIFPGWQPPPQPPVSNSSPT